MVARERQKMADRSDTRAVSHRVETENRFEYLHLSQYVDARRDYIAGPALVLAGQEHGEHSRYARSPLPRQRLFATDFGSGCIRGSPSGKAVQPCSSTAGCIRLSVPKARELIAILLVRCVGLRTENTAPSRDIGFVGRKSG
jgi:hypothetical protein